jgi:hypothetical protein
MFDEFAPLGSPEIIRVGILIDHLMGGVFKEGVAATRVKADPKQIYGTARPDPHGMPKPMACIGKIGQDSIIFRNWIDASIDRDFTIHRIEGRKEDV